MTERYTTICPDIETISVKLENAIVEKKEHLESTIPGLSISYKKGIQNRFQMTFIVSFLLLDKNYNEEEKTIYILLMQNRKDGMISVAITSSEKAGLNILYNNISKNPILSLMKYFGGIVDSTISIVKNSLDAEPIELGVISA